MPQPGRRGASKKAQNKTGHAPKPRTAAPTAEPAPARYTPPPRVVRFRPRWHMWAGIAQVLLGVALVVVNYGEELGLSVLPGGHQEVYFLAGVVVAAGSTWWFGWFDRPTR